MPSQNQSNEEFEKFLDALNKALPVFAEGTAEIAANQLRTKIQVRIFEGGEDSTESSIGSYSTKPGYFPLKYKTKSAGIGRNKKGETKRADGTAYKSQYLPGGYAEFRQKLGRQNQKVDFDITGELKQSITQVRTTQGENLIFNQEKFSEIAEGLEKRFKGKGDSIFIPSNKEAETVLDFIEEQFNELINELAARYNFKV